MRLKIKYCCIIKVYGYSRKIEITVNSMIAIFSSEVVKIRYRYDEFVVNGVCLKQYYSSVLMPLFRHLEEDILVQDGPKIDAFLYEPYTR